MNLLHLLDDEKCFQVIRAHRWPNRVRRPHCGTARITKQGRDELQRARQRYRCLACRQKFDDLPGTVFAGHHQPLRVWVAGLYLMGLNLSNRQIAHELGINEVHVNTIEGVWSLLRSWLRPHRGISQRFLPLYIGFFQAMHNIRQRGQSLLSPQLSLLLTSAP